MPPQPTWDPGALAGHWVPNYNNGLLAVDVEGDRYGDGVYTGACPLYLQRSPTDLLLVVASLSRRLLICHTGQAPYFIIHHNNLSFPPSLSPLVRQCLRVRLCAQQHMLSPPGHFSTLLRG